MRTIAGNPEKELKSVILSPLNPTPLSEPAGPDEGQIEALRRAIADIERGTQGSGRPRRVATGFPAIDQDLPDGGLALGAVHEISGPLAHGFAARILTHLSGPVLWFRTKTEPAQLYAPALKAIGCPVEQWFIAYTGTPKDLLWGLEEGLRSGAVDAVIGEPTTALSITASRRLQLAAERGKALGLILTGGRASSETTGPLSPSTLTSRWHVRPIPNPASDTTPRWQVRLLKLRNASSASWSVQPNPPMHPHMQPAKTLGV